MPTLNIEVTAQFDDVTFDQADLMDRIGELVLEAGASILVSKMTQEQTLVTVQRRDDG